MDALTHRLRVRLSPSNFDKLSDAARKPKESRSLIIDRALKAYFSYELEDKRDANIIARLDLLSRHDARHTRDLNLVTETMSLFVLYYLTMTPEIQDADKQALADEGVLKFKLFVNRLGGYMKGGGRTLFRALEDILVGDEDFFTKEEIERFAKAKLGQRKSVQSKAPKSGVRNVN